MHALKTFVTALSVKPGSGLYVAGPQACRLTTIAQLREVAQTPPLSVSVGDLLRSPDAAPAPLVAMAVLPPVSKT